MRSSEFGMRNEPDLKKRTKAFALRILKLVDALPTTTARRALASQIVRSGSSAAANYRAACRAKSTADFIAKMGIVEEEADETLFWLELLEESQLVGAAKLTAVKQEANELIAITVASIKTARRNRVRNSAFRIRMNFPHFFIDRPIFAGVISIVITLVGVIALLTLPIAQYPDIAPPTIQVTATYPGANAQVVSETVATPIEQQVNGVENMLYMSSQSTSDGNMTLSITFKLGTILDTAQVLVQNRVAIAIPILPPDVQRSGVTTKKQSPDITMVVHLVSPDGSLDQLFTSNYALLQIRDELARLDGVGNINVFGAREYSMRIWLDPNKTAARDLTAQDVVQALQEQNVQVAAGIIGAPPVPKGATAFQYTVSTQGRLADEKEFGAIIVKTGANGQVTRVRDIARVELAARDYTVNSGLGGKPATAIAIFQLPGSNALATSDAVRKKMAELKQRFPSGLDYTIVYDPTVSVRESIHEVQKTLFEAIALVVLVVLIFLQTWRAAIIPLIAIPVSLIGTFAAMKAFGFSINNVSLFGLVLAIGIVVDDAIVVVEAI